MRDRLHLPPWARVLAVVAHPDDESFGLGAVLSTWVDAGASVTVLCFTRGEASTLQGVPGDLSQIRAAELTAAANVLGVTSVELLDYPDGALRATPVDELAAHVERVARVNGAAGLLAFDPSGVTGHPDHRHATAAAIAAGARLGLPVLGWTLPAETALALNRELGTVFVGQPESRVDLTVTVNRARQHRAAHCHESQVLPTGVLWRRLEMLGDSEHLRWLQRPGTGVAGGPGTGEGAMR